MVDICPPRQPDPCCDPRCVPTHPPPPQPCPQPVPCPRVAFPPPREACLRYLQPPVARSFRPERYYCPPQDPLETNTVYKMSFNPVKCEGCRGEQFRHKDNIKTPMDDSFSSTTTTRMDFRPWGPVPPEKPVIPCNRALLGGGLMSALTTHRHDFVAKPTRKQDPIMPPTHLRCVKAPLECATVTRMSYQPPPCMPPKCSFKPLLSYNKPMEPMDVGTVQKLSYVPWPTQPKEKEPGFGRGRYTCPAKPMECMSVYQASFFPPGAFEQAVCPAGPPSAGDACRCPDCRGSLASGCRADCFDCCVEEHAVDPRCPAAVY